MRSFLARARFSRDHRWAPAHMSDYLDAELLPHGHGRMERHLGECGECRRVLTDLRVILEGLHRLPRPGGGLDAVQIVAAVRLQLWGPPSGR